MTSLDRHVRLHELTSRDAPSRLKDTDTDQRFRAHVRRSIRERHACQCFARDLHRLSWLIHRFKIELSPQPTDKHFAECDNGLVIAGGLASEAIQRSQHSLVR